jgi:hypothetical protein
MMLDVMRRMVRCMLLQGLRAQVGAHPTDCGTTARWSTVQGRKWRLAMQTSCILRT